MHGLRCCLQKEGSQLYTVFMGPHRPPDILLLARARRSQVLTAPIVYLLSTALLCAPPQLRREQTWARVQFFLEHLPQLKLRQISFPLWRGTRRLGPVRLVRAFLAGPLEYKGHTQLHKAHSVVPPQGKGDKLPNRQRSTHATTRITPADNIHASQHSTCVSPHTYITSRLTAHVHHAPPPLPSVVTPVNVQALSALLTHHPDKKFVQYGFHFGFSIGYTGKHTARHTPNLQFVMSHPHVINEYITNECAVGRTAGPFSSPPFSTFTVSTNP